MFGGYGKLFFNLCRFGDNLSDDLSGVCYGVVFP